MKLPEIDGLNGMDPTFSGSSSLTRISIITGSVQKAPPDTHIFIGSDAEKILRAAMPFGSFGDDISECDALQA